MTKTKDGMPLIEGVGDEVVQFVAAVVVVVVAALAWWSTSARPDRYRTVLVMRPRPHPHHPLTVRIFTRAMEQILPSQNNTPQSTATTNASNTSTSTARTENPSEGARVIPIQEMDSIVDADLAMINHHRLHFYRRLDTPSTTESTSEESDAQEETEPAGNAQIREMDSIVSAMEADVSGEPFPRNAESSLTKKPTKPDNKDKDETTTSRVTSSNDTTDANASSEAPVTENVVNEENANIGDTRKILIKLKYLNDTLKEVEGSLDELLKDFKWRHFSTELSSRCLVRLIFRGRVLADEAATLRALGLHHRAVVHCLVQRTAQRAPTDESPISATHELVTEGQQERVWDLENILMTLVSVALTVVWFFRCEYSSMFTASASVALFGLTVFYSVAIFGLYLTDTFHFDRRPQQPAAN